jgi:hypothetical protein
MRASVLASIVVVVLAGCSGAASPTPSPAASVQPLSVAPSASALATQPPPAASPTPEPSPAVLDWGQPIVIQGDRFEIEVPFASAPGAFITVYQTAIAFSTDGVHWENVDSPITDIEADSLNAVAIGPTGIVAVGEEGIVAPSNETIGSNALVLFSPDGRTWQRISDPAFNDGQMQLVGATRQGFVAFGRDFSNRPVIWTSPDGRDWLRATNETGLTVARGVRMLISGDGRLTALVGPPRTFDGPDTVEFEVWQTDGRAEWQHVGRLPDRATQNFLKGAFGGGRWLVMDRANAWTSTDGIAWLRGTSPVPEGIAGLTAIAAYRGGYIAVGESGSRPDETCGGNEPWVGHTWTSTDAIEWHEQPTFKSAAIYQLVLVDDTLLGLGRTAHPDFGMTPAVWSVGLPASLGGPLPTPTPTPSPTPARSSDGCGG